VDHQHAARPGAERTAQIVAQPVACFVATQAMQIHLEIRRRIATPQRTQAPAVEAGRDAIDPAATAVDQDEAARLGIRFPHGRSVPLERLAVDAAAALSRRRRRPARAS
jgi:hypothetical protein